MISTDDRRNPLKHLTETSGDEYPSKTLKVLYEYSQRGERGCAELLLKNSKMKLYTITIQKNGLSMTTGSG